MRQETAEETARDVLVWLAQDEELLPVFLGATGVGPADIQKSLYDPIFLASILDFLLLDDVWIRRFCAATGHSLTDPQTARTMLPGGENVHWT